MGGTVGGPRGWRGEGRGGGGCGEGLRGGRRGASGLGGHFRAFKRLLRG